MDTALIGWGGVATGKACWSLGRIESEWQSDVWKRGNFVHATAEKNIILLLSSSIPGPHLSVEKRLDCRRGRQQGLHTDVTQKTLGPRVMSLKVETGYRVTLVVEYLGWVDFDLGSSPGWWAATLATYYPSRPGRGGTPKIIVN